MALHGRNRSSSEKGSKRKFASATVEAPVHKKRKTSHAAAIPPDETIQNEEEAMPIVGVEPESTEAEQTIGSREKKNRFIAFIGNLPYTTTTDAIAKHFAKLKPLSIRHRTEKGSEKSKGFAFIEFDRFDRMKTCLKLYHHSEFNDGISPSRKINVELTAGGGGKGKQRKLKIQEKNQKLKVERKKKVKQDKRTKHEKTTDPAQEDSQDNQEANSTHGIHPSRLARMELQV